VVLCCLERLYQAETMPDVSVISYGIGNVQSVVNALRRVGADVAIAEDGDALLAQGAPRLVLPGVGAVGEALALLRSRGLEKALRVRVLEQGIPLLGICVGMQVLLERCSEFGQHQGFGWIPGSVDRIVPEGDALRLPHVGWNEISLCRPDPLLHGTEGKHFYFLHSYAVDCPDEFVVARVEYGRRFVSALRHGNVVAVQFHPEKSSGTGESVLAAFVRH
jgi:glutamine amidotransferase